MKTVTFVTSLLLMVAPVAAATFVNEAGLSDGERYHRCIELARQDADAAHHEALVWYDVGGGVAAQHCAAVALFMGKHYPEAAQKLDQLAKARDTPSTDLRAEILDQAGNAWLMAGEADRAEASISGALNLGDHSADTYADRARARAMKKDWPGAASDLDQALAKDAYRTDLLVLRASAREALGWTKDALADLDQALQIDPGYTDALIERGTLRLEDGDPNGARADWLLVVSNQPKSPAADLARSRLQQLSVIAQQPAGNKATRH